MATRGLTHGQSPAVPTTVPPQAKRQKLVHVAPGASLTQDLDSPPPPQSPISPPEVRRTRFPTCSSPKRSDRPLSEHPASPVLVEQGNTEAYVPGTQPPETAVLPTQDTQPPLGQSEEVLLAGSLFDDSDPESSLI
jgi:hypothetical protein